MKRASQICFVLLLSTGIGSGALACGDNPVLTSVHSSRLENTSTKRGLFIPLEWVRNAPIWSPGQGDIPLPLEDALGLAHDWAKEQNLAGSNIEVTEITLKSCRPLNTWYYLVNFNFADVHVVAVLFDGTLIGLTDIE